MKKLSKLIFDIRLSEIIEFFKRLFRIYPKKFVKKSIKMSFEKEMFLCEKRLESRQKVEEFAKFYHRNKELLYYIAWDLSYTFKNSANAYLKFFEDCANEVNKYKLQEEAEEKSKQTAKLK